MGHIYWICGLNATARAWPLADEVIEQPATSPLGPQGEILMIGKACLLFSRHVSVPTMEAR